MLKAFSLISEKAGNTALALSGDARHFREDLNVASCDAAGDWDAKVMCPEVFKRNLGYHLFCDVV